MSESQVSENVVDFEDEDAIIDMINLAMAIEDRMKQSSRGS